MFTGTVTYKYRCLVKYYHDSVPTNSQYNKHYVVPNYFCKYVDLKGLIACYNIASS